MMELRTLALFGLASGLLAAPPAPPRKYNLPEGPGKALVERVCTQCHGLENVVRSRKSAKEWSNVIDDMSSRGAQATDDEFDQIQNYLTANFGPGSAGAKVNVNAATAADLVSALGISKADADAIVAYRAANGPFHAIQDVEKTPGIDVKKIEAAAARVDFR